MKMVQRAFALVLISVLLLGLSGAGCDQRPCNEGDFVVDNRDRRFFPDKDADWICLDQTAFEYTEPPLVEPDVSVSWPLDVGPKDPDAVVKMAILIHTCLPSFQVVSPRLNRTIHSAYFEYLRNATNQAMFSRSGCFKDNFNGCDAIRECYGIVDEVISLPGKDSNLPTAQPTPGCADGIRREAHVTRNAEDDEAVFYNTWVNCKGLGLECNYDYIYYWCTSPRTPCEPEETVSTCKDDRIYRCHDDFAINKAAYYYEKPRCSDFGLKCDELKDEPWWTPNSLWSDCVGTGAECLQGTSGFWVSDDALFNYEMGTACESDTVLRACVGTGEKLVDCAQLGQGFKCIPEGVPHCGFATECDWLTPVTCDGDSLVVCDAGKIRKVDCKTLGFTTCDEAHSLCGPNQLFD